uniref:Uncharacterized protein n=1 Tax=Fusarium oxysporum (strain Fo5176) TaxID=660025 RepID=A0A0D2YEW6_FUSOF
MSDIRHKYMASAARHQVAEAVDRLPGIIKNQPQLAAEFQFPPPTIPPIQLDPRNLMGEDVQYASVFSGTTKRFNNTMPLSISGLILKVAEGPGYMMLMQGPKNHG